MAIKISIESRLQKFLDDYSMLAGSRDGYPKIALTLNDVRELMEKIDASTDEQCNASD